ncbi:MAG: hypothetical protein WAT58_05730 [Candidatus Dormiibacterota bacterium]
MTRRAGVLLVLAALLGLQALGAVVALADPGPDSSGDTSTSQAIKDGCTRSPLELIQGNSPQWAYVYDDHSSVAPPAPRRVTGVVNTRDYKTQVVPNSLFEAVKVAGDDLPAGHDDYDLNVDIQPDLPQYAFLLAGHQDMNNIDNRTGNYRGNGDDYASIHSELQSDAIPLSLWPEQGDRIDLIGNWIWDCGHWGTPTEVFSPDYVLPKVGTPAQQCLGNLATLKQGGVAIFDPAQCHIAGESTEIHPWRAMWDVHAQSLSPEAEAEGLLYVSTYETRAGLVENCAHQFPPVNGIANPAAKLCVLTGAMWQDVTGDYSYFLPAPPKPSALAHLTYRAVDLGSVGAPAPTLTPEGNGVRVTFHLNTPPTQDLRMYYKVLAGWDELPLAQVPAHLHVTFDNVVFHRTMDCPGQGETGCGSESQRQNQASLPPGEWNLYYDVQGAWGRLFHNGEVDPSEGDTLSPNQSVDIYVPPGKGWRLLTLGRECDLQLLATVTGNVNITTQGLAPGTFGSCPGANTTAPAEIADGNDVPGRVLQPWSSVQASLGTHTVDASTNQTGDPTSTCPADLKATPPLNPHGCYTLTYTVSAVEDAASRVLIPSPSSSLPNTLVPPPPPAAMAAIGLGGAAVLLLLYLLPTLRRRPG